MKVYISVDMEGIAGVVHRDHTGRGEMDYELARDLMTNEANAAITGALNAGATEVLVNDSHGTMRNIKPNLLRKEARLLSGTPKKLGMMEGIDVKHDAALFIGYHTKASSQGVLNHTYNSRTIQSISVNGKQMGEFGINSLVAGGYGVPVVFVSGCNLLIEEAKDHIPNVYHKEVKRSINRVSADSVHPTIACNRIEAGVKEALEQRQSVVPYTLQEEDCQIEICFLNTLLADVAETLPIVKRTSSLCVGFEAKDIEEGFLLIRSLMMMTSNVV